ncbi:hypothetical protein BSU04_13505 [Caballeronia sordidicola]|uniref:Uncharacterized protein n=1 Tax=Caballeronia sordidicola TaxID=196367 RepID=A0A226X3W5_CABSO|nr:hypothetical protein BSU04_13505 [Caballeronia sordidicola]
MGGCKQQAAGSTLKVNLLSQLRKKPPRPPHSARWEPESVTRRRVLFLPDVQ